MCIENNQIYRVENQRSCANCAVTLNSCGDRREVQLGYDRFLQQNNCRRLQSNPKSGATQSNRTQGYY
jgi:hypothetical protein